jgi:hypothetical protein
MTWFKATSLTIANNSAVATVVSGEDISNIQPGDGLIVGAFTPVEIKRVYIDGSNNKLIELVSVWPDTAQIAVPSRVLPTSGDFAGAVQALKDATALLSGTFAPLDAWYSTMGSVVFTEQSGVEHSVRTVKQMDADAELSAINAAAAWDQAVSDMETKDQNAYRESVEAASAGKNSVFWDAQDNANVMVWINKFNSEDVNAEILIKTGVDLQLGTGTFPAFIKDGVELRGFWYAKYQASSGENGGCSVIAGVQPKESINYDQARALCVNKGANWHMASNLEWCAVSFLSLAYGQNVRGNTNYGRSHTAKYETARRDDTLASGDTAGTGRTDCGTGPATWSHDGTIFGVFDLVGNVWEWVDQLLMQEGQIIAPLDNNPALLEAQWTAHAVYLDSSGATGGDAILNSVITNRTGDLGDNGSGNGASSNAWAVTAKDASYIENTLMRQMAIESASAINLEGRLYLRNFGERAPIRGGNWVNGSAAGLGALSFYHSRTAANSALGFRPALFES